jgi:SPP1 gp7 family putative phage head morphogenesis protein
MVSSTATSLIQARATHAGSPGYIWHTAMDAAVRPEHRAMEGKYVEWDDPPTIQNYTAHAGQFANCRCWPRPVWSKL